MIFTAQHYASAVYGVAICLSVCAMPVSVLYQNG